MQGQTLLERMVCYMHYILQLGGLQLPWSTSMTNFAEKQKWLWWLIEVDPCEWRDTVYPKYQRTENRLSFVEIYSIHCTTRLGELWDMEIENNVSYILGYASNIRDLRQDRNVPFQTGAKHKIWISWWTPFFQFHPNKSKPPIGHAFGTIITDPSKTLHCFKFY